MKFEVARNDTCVKFTTHTQDSSWLRGWSIKKEVDLVSITGLLVSFVVAIFVFVLGKRFSRNRYEREYIITLLKDFYPLVKCVHESFETYRFTKQPITPANDLKLRREINRLRDQVLLTKSAVKLMKKHCKKVSGDRLQTEYRNYKKIVTTNTVGHTRTFDVTNDNVVAEDGGYQSFMQLIHIFIFELNVL
jgi:hypothetical protein